MADALHTSHSNYSKVEIGQNQASDDVVAAAAIEFGVAAEWIRTGEGQGITEPAEIYQAPPRRPKPSPVPDPRQCGKITCDQIKDVIRILMDDDVVVRLKRSAVDLDVDEVEIALVYVKRKLAEVEKGGTT
jgi:transcriptional regulator with XRE-family HTH domain